MLDLLFDLKTHQLVKKQLVSPMEYMLVLWANVIKNIAKFNGYLYGNRHLDISMDTSE
jgi:hypothetical protein